MASLRESSGWATTHHPCSKCGSKDNAATNHDGWTTCFGCGERYKGDGDYAKTSATERRDKIVTMIVGKGEYKATRGIEAATCERYGIRVDGNREVFEYRDANGLVCAQKVRTGGKHNQHSEGDWSAGQLFGQHLFNGGGKFITITEGEYDAAAAYQMMGSKYPVVSIKNGCKSALRDCKAAYQWLDSFENVVVCFDSDQQGREAAREVAALFAGKAKVMKHHPDFKDANEYLQRRRHAEFNDWWWKSERYTPEGIVAGSSLWEELRKPIQKPLAKYQWDGLNKITHGIRGGELVTMAAGSGVGKSQVTREIMYHLLMTQQGNIGALFLEEHYTKTALSMLSLHAHKRLHLEEVPRTEQEMQEAFKATLGTDRLFFYNHFGSISVEEIMSQVRYLSKAQDCRYIFLDHLSIIVSSQENGDERKAIDEVMTKLRTLTEETGVALFLVSHLKRPMGKGHEEGAQVSLAEMRGSASIAQLSDIVLGFERNGQADDEEERNTMNVRVLKNRFSGETGKACSLLYNTHTGRMKETNFDFNKLSDSEVVL